MHASPNSSLVRIRRVDGAVIGSGFLVGERQILTCAHVITQALRMADDAVVLPQSSVSLDFPLIAPKRTLRAHVILWQPAQNDGGGDIAGLELQSDPPEGVQAAFLALADDLWEHPFRAFGFPAGQDDGVWTTGRLLDKQATNWVMIEDVKEQGFPVARGFSGTPIWDVQLQGVVGMVVAAEGRAEIKAAYAIPVDVLLAAWPMLEARLLPRVFISSAPADAAFAARLKTDLQNRGVFAISPDHERAVHQAIRYANAMLLVASPHTRSSRIVKEHLRIAGMYRRHVVFLWVAGEEVIQALPRGEQGCPHRCPPIEV